jgi:MerR family transcriptional regulator, redox-sensitive transcriptional activator SoxR
MVASLTIGEVARRAGVRASAIRYYESLGILPAPQRVNGRRRYDANVLYLLLAIGIAKQAGFTMNEMRQLFGSVEHREAPSAVWERLARQKLQEVDALIDQAHAMKALLEEGLRCGCLTMEECVILGPLADAEPVHTA